MHLRFTILFVTFCNLLVSAQTNKAQLLKFYIPKDYSILDSASGNLNNDSYKDLVLILKYKYESTGGDTTRPLLLLAGTKENRYFLMAKNDSVVLCKECGGIFGDPYQGITIKKGFFSIEHYGGSSWRWTRIITFKYDVKSKQFLLHRDAGVSYHNTEHPIKETVIISNKSDFDKLNFVNYSYEKAYKQ